MFWALLAHSQEVLNKLHFVYCTRVMSVGWYQEWSGTGVEDKSRMEASSVGKREYRGKGRWFKYWACVGCWISPCYGPFSLGAHFELTNHLFLQFSILWGATLNCGYWISRYRGMTLFVSGNKIKHNANQMHYFYGCFITSDNMGEYKGNVIYCAYWNCRMIMLINENSVPKRHYHWDLMVVRIPMWFTHSKCNSVNWPDMTSCWYITQQTQWM
jgi:hypothetical protein